MKCALLIAGLLTSLIFLKGDANSTPHSVTVKFDYDFSSTPACAPGQKTGCVQQFVVYDITAGSNVPNRVTLGTVNVPAGAKGLVKGISGKVSPPPASGKRLLSVVAQMPDGTASNPTKCTSCTTTLMVP
jgi:hypothetical protein